MTFPIRLTKQDNNSFDASVTYQYPYHLQIFAKEGSAGEKTEEATTKKLQDARLEGQVARSKELTTASGLITLFLVLKIFLGYIGNQLMLSLYGTYQNIDKISRDGINVAAFNLLFRESISSILLICLPVFAAAMVVAVIVNLFQVKWKLSGKAMKPKFNKINPISGFKKIVSKDKIVELIISLIKIAAIFWISYDTLKNQWSILLLLYDINLDQAIVIIGNMVIDLGLKISIIFLIVGFADYIYQKFKFKKDMRMTKQEVKDEYKSTEGDPQVKNKIKAKMREVSRKRMMQELPKADVVITNPTHLAAAIKYDKEVSDAPILVAKGADHLAQKIKEIAKENQIEIVENKPLARMLYYNVDIGAEIPSELYQMTAEVLAYVYGLKNKS